MADALSRRRVLQGLSAALGLVGTGLLSLPGCGVYEAEDGAAFDPWRFPGDETVPERIVARAALLAASPHNTQPWGLTVRTDAVELRARLDRHLGAMDSLRRELYVGLGCAVENMAIAARAVGRTGDVAWLPSGDDPALVARVTLAPTDPQAGALFSAVARRHTNRGAYVDGAPAPGLEQALRGLVDDPAVALHLLVSAAERTRFRDETIGATRAITEDTAMSEDSERWYRHSADEIERTRDGTTLDATGSGAGTRSFGKALGRPSRETADAYWLDATETRQTTASAFVVLSSLRRNTREDQLRVGRVFQRLALFATSQGLATQPLNQLAERQDREETAGLEPRFTRVLGEIVGDERRAQMLFRVGYPWDRAFASPRRPLAWVLT